MYPIVEALLLHVSTVYEAVRAWEYACCAPPKGIVTTSILQQQNADGSLSPALEADDGTLSPALLQIEDGDEGDIEIVDESADLQKLQARRQKVRSLRGMMTRHICVFQNFLHYHFNFLRAVGNGGFEHESLWLQILLCSIVSMLRVTHLRRLTQRRSGLQALTTNRDPSQVLLHAQSELVGAAVSAIAAAPDDSKEAAQMYAIEKAKHMDADEEVSRA